MNECAGGARGSQSKQLITDLIERQATFSWRFRRRVTQTAEEPRKCARATERPAFLDNLFISAKKEATFVYQKLLLFLSIAKAMAYHHALACISSP